jgi:hypothetical protein
MVQAVGCEIAVIDEKDVQIGKVRVGGSDTIPHAPPAKAVT